MEMFITLRLVVDTASTLWAGRGEGVELMRENLMETDTQIGRSPPLLVRHPGQALAYKMGALEIRRLRERRGPPWAPFRHPALPQAVLGAARCR